MGRSPPSRGPPGHRARTDAREGFADVEGLAVAIEVPVVVASRLRLGGRAATGAGVAAAGRGERPAAPRRLAFARGPRPPALTVSRARGRAGLARILDGEAAALEHAAAKQ